MPERGDSEAPSALSHVFRPVTIGGLELPHRIVMGSMHLGVEAAEDAATRLAAFYRERALGGAGLIVTGGWAVSEDGAADHSYGVLGGGSGAPRRAGPNPPIAPVKSTEADRAPVRTTTGGRVPDGSIAAGRGQVRTADRRAPVGSTAASRKRAEAAKRALSEVAGATDGTEAAIALQLFHAGRYALADSPGEVVAPSAITSRVSRVEPRALGEDEAWDVIAEFAAGAKLARELGFAAVEVMGSEGYLVDQFLSPLTNRRDDAWGGDAERRMRFGIELAGAVRAAVGVGFPVLFRMTGAELMPGSRPWEEVEAFATALVGAGVDALNIGVGWHESPVPTVQGAVPAGAFVPWAEGIKGAIGGRREGVKARPGGRDGSPETAITGTAATSAGMAAVPVIAGNRVNGLDVAEAVLAAGGVDLVSMSRPFLADPRIVAKGRRGGAVNLCISCDQACIDVSLTGGHVSCLVNPRAGHEVDFPVPPQSSSQRSSDTEENCELTAGDDPAAAADDPAAAADDPPVTGDGPPAAGDGTAAAGGGTAAAGDPAAGGGRAARGAAAGGGRAARGAAAVGGGRFVVIGGGPAGLEAARVLATLGGEVHLYEAREELGGQFRWARLVPGKEDYGATISYFESELRRLGVHLHLGRELGEDDADVLTDCVGVVLATGVHPRAVDISGASLPHVVDYASAFESGLGDARSVAIVGGGGIGVDLAHLLTHATGDGQGFYERYGVAVPSAVGDLAMAEVSGRTARNPSPGRITRGAGGSIPGPRPKVTVIRRSGRVGSGIGPTTRWVWLDALKHAGVETRTGLSYRRITADGVEIELEGGTVETIAADRVVIAAGQERRDELRPLLERLEVPRRVVGGAENPSELNAVRAFGDGLRAAYELAGHTPASR